ncbi:alpha/beta hydrolase [Algihabitans albus]|uniref:alpha/beta hydrolase n=1 Tax=Algihabitans albus TaxID=2164067 RepID=UPI000E5C9B6B|nr:hypothetical protein [Algihabitans albus]
MKSPKDYRAPCLWRRPLAPLWLRPWYDGPATWSVARLHLPLSRAWAETEAERGSALERYRSAEAAWRHGFFAAASPGPEDLARLEQSRRRAAAAWMGRRLRHLPAMAGAPAAAFAIEPPDAVEARHAERLEAPEAAFPLPDAVPRESHTLQQGAQESVWLCFPARDGSTAWARLERPAAAARGAAVKGTVIALHGICIEADFWPRSPDYSDRALAAGWQVLRLEAPWHGRRRRPGTYGGEPLIARGPAGFLEFFELAVPELAVWTAWAKRQGPVAWSGVSLGALTAQKAAEVARHWPERSQPDGLLLITTAADVTQATPVGSLGRLLGLRARLQAAGWTEPALARWVPLLNPMGGPVLPPERIRLLLGSADRLLPFAQGAALARCWNLPARRVTVRRQGHFSVSLGLLAEPAPLLDLLRELA